jgi:hypothetical protein
MNHHDVGKPVTEPHQPGIEAEMPDKPAADSPTHRGSGKLQGRIALITGGDSGIGRAVAIRLADFLFAEAII